MIMDRIQAYAYGLVSGMRKSASADDIVSKISGLHKFATAIKAAKAKTGKTSPQLEKIAAWYEHILPALSGAVSGGWLGGLTPWAPITAPLGAIIGGGYGLYDSLYGPDAQYREERAKQEAEQKKYDEAMKKFQLPGQLPQEFVELMKAQGEDPATLTPIQRPKWLTDELQTYLNAYGIDPMEYVARQQAQERWKKRSEEEKAKQKAKEEERKAIAAKPMTYSERRKLLGDTDDEQTYSGYGDYGDYDYTGGGAPGRPYHGGGRVIPTSMHSGFWSNPDWRQPFNQYDQAERDAFEKFTGGTPADMAAQREASRWMKIRGGVDQDLNERFNRAMMSGIEPTDGAF